MTIKSLCCLGFFFGAASILYGTAISILVGVVTLAIAALAFPTEP